MRDILHGNNGELSEPELTAWRKRGNRSEMHPRGAVSALEKNLEAIFFP